MRIAVNTRFLQKDNLEGIGRFSFEILKRMVFKHPEVEFIFLFDRKFDASFLFAPNVKAYIVYPQARHPFLYYIWFQYSLKRKLKALKADVFLSPDGFLPLNVDVKKVAVIHDIAFEHYPKAIDWLSAVYYRYFFPKFARQADAIVTVSNFSKADIAQKYQISESKITVIYNGVSDVFKPLLTQEKHPFKFEKPYFIYTGAIHPRKNILRLLKAFESFKAKHQLAHVLVLTGRKAWKNQELENYYQHMQYKADVIFTGKLPDDELVSLVTHATAAVYPSYFEGFGLPVIEAFACGTPVITSKNTAMEEISGGLAYLINPFNVFDLENALLKLANMQPDKEQQRKRIAFAQSYSWDVAADKLWETIQI